MKKIGFIIAIISLILIRLGLALFSQSTESLAKEVGLIEESAIGMGDVKDSGTVYLDKNQSKPAPVAPISPSRTSQETLIENKQPEVAEEKTEASLTQIEVFDPVNGCYYNLKAFNQLSKETLMNFKGIGEKTAEAILRYRQDKGPFLSFEELMNIKGIGEKKLASILLNSR